MKRDPIGCANIGGKMAAKLEHCRNRALELFAFYGYRPFSPAELQLLDGAWDKLSQSRRERLIALTSPFGEPCVLRGDLTLSAVTYLSSHFQDEERPLRLSYADRVFSVPKPPRRNLEQNQIGIELIGWEGAGADAEVISLLFKTLEELGIDGIVAVGDVSVLSNIFAGLPKEAAELLTGDLQKGFYTGYLEKLEDLELPANIKRLLSALPSLKGGTEVIREAEEMAGEGDIFAPLKKLCSELEKLGCKEKLRVDLGFIRDLGYYSGPIFNAYTKDGTLIGGGGRYDGLLAKLGMDGEAVGFALDLKELAANCSGSLPLPRLMLWCGSESPAECLRFAEGLRKKNLSFELSWCGSAAESKATAKLREYGWWADFAGRKLVKLETGEEFPLEGLEGRLLS